MHRKSSEPRRQERLSRKPPILIVPDQDHEMIEWRRRIREAFHDSKARTIKGKQPLR
jgi:hypothetical protein